MSVSMTGSSVSTFSRSDVLRNTIMSPAAASGPSIEASDDRVPDIWPAAAGGICASACV